MLFSPTMIVNCSFSDTSEEVKNMVEAESRAQDNIRKMILEEAIRKAKKIMEGHPEKMFTIEEYQRFHQYPCYILEDFINTIFLCVATW